MRTPILVAMLWSFVPLASPSALSIDLFSAPDCSTAVLCIPPGRMGTLHVTASTEGLPPGEFLTGAEFRVVGLPPGWSAVSAAETGAALVGDPFGEGANVLFGTSQVSSCIPLCTVTLTAASLAIDIELQVTHRVTPSYPELLCPRVSIICSARPCDISHCVAGGSILINPSTRLCSVGTSQSTWSALKDLYK